MKYIVFCLFFIFNFFSNKIIFNLNFIGQPVSKKLLINKYDLCISGIKNINNKLKLRSIIENDIIFCKKILRGYGFFYSKVTFSLKEKPGQYLVDINVDYGKKIIVKELKIRDIHNNEIIIKNSILWKRLDFAKLISLETDIITFFGDIGYPFVKILKKKVKIFHNKNYASVCFKVDLGEKKNFGNVYVIGNSAVKASFILKQVIWKEGELFKYSKIEELKSKLLKFNIFNQVDITYKQSPIKDKVDVEIRVNESKTKLLEIGAKYSTSNNVFYSKKFMKKMTGVLATLSWTDFNLFGYGEVLNFYFEGMPFYANKALSGKAEINKVTPDFLLRGKFTKPKYDGVKDSITCISFYNSWNIKYLKRSKEAEFRITHIKKKKIMHSIGVSCESYRITEFETIDGKGNLHKSSYNFINFAYKLIFADLDNPIDPSNGYKLEIYTSPKISNKARLIEVMVKNSLIKDINFVTVTGWISYTGIFTNKIKELPADKMLYSGGPNSIRSYAKNYASTFNGDYPNGGRSCIEASIEFSKKINKDWGGVVFFEASKLNLSTLPLSAPTFYGIGFGARYYTSAGPVRIDVAFPLKKRSIDSMLQIMISFGASI